MLREICMIGCLYRFLHLVFEFYQTFLPIFLVGLFPRSIILNENLFFEICKIKQTKNSQFIVSCSTSFILWKNFNETWSFIGLKSQTSKIMMILNEKVFSCIKLISFIMKFHIEFLKIIQNFILVTDGRLL